MSLKRNIHYSKFCSSWLFLYFITNLYLFNDLNSKDSLNQSNYYIEADEFYHELSTHSYTTLLTKSLKSLKKQIQLRFYQQVSNECKEVIDETKLSQVLRNIKMEELIFMKKNFASILLPKYPLDTEQITKNYSFNHNQTIIGKEYLSEIQQQILNFMKKLEKEVFLQNSKKATVLNQTILENEYQKIIEGGLKRQRLRKKQRIESSSSLNSYQHNQVAGEEPSHNSISMQNTTKELLQDFNHFIDAYSLKGIKVSSQMKTFDDFMEKKKHSYLKNIQQFTRDKKTPQQEGEQKQKKNRVIKLLQMEIFKLEDKKKELKDKNELIKKQIKNIDDKSLIHQSPQKNSFHLNHSKDPKSNVQTENHHKLKLGNHFNKEAIKILPQIQKNNGCKNLNSVSMEIEKDCNRKFFSNSGSKDFKKQTYNRFSKKTAKQNEDGKSQNNKKVCLDICCQIM